MSAPAEGRVRSTAPSRVAGSGAEGADDAILTSLDAPTRALVRLAAIIADADERTMRVALEHAVHAIPAEWVEELILQSYLFAGFPRTLNAMRAWRKASGRRAPASDPGADLANAPAWAAEGEETCAAVYGPFYERLRPNIRALHPALDAWMIVDGYGKVLSRPGLDLARRELCVIAVCAVARQDRQLHSHLHGALHVGTPPQVVEDALDALADLMSDEDHARARHLWSHVRATQQAS
ncbi:carboxymuconolactone decarboxylase family protein [Roseisolibacter sp. H3M3-2]|uniref:carboxymuconolactone decarboxylase family protein n=1 Tax=Roseisolibacter sp. H3M3-2 TaxID=3031323 RepID=UPI0023DAA7C7|nr:carboxymuconolactone decarboxylase family protein [Roseisolibacter sp. H3M3-2]MDF1503773.1 carboxymuconolactone decarboxylase family protein [Roseisolibacter sp. H3M3-2]